ncbi:hypothetical protein OC835_007953, partial [Tilletia horrida]
MRTGRRKERNLSSLPRVLAELQTQVDSLDELKAQYYHEVIESEEEVWESILSKVSLMVRSQLEVSERIASKGSSDPVQRLAWLNFAGYRDRQRARSGRPTQGRPRAAAADGPVHARCRRLRRRPASHTFLFLFDRTALGVSPPSASLRPSTSGPSCLWPCPPRVPGPPGPPACRPRASITRRWHPARTRLLARARLRRASAPHRAPGHASTGSQPAPASTGARSATPARPHASGVRPTPATPTARARPRRRAPGHAPSPPPASPLAPLAPLAPRSSPLARRASGLAPRRPSPLVAPPASPGVAPRPSRLRPRASSPLARRASGLALASARPRGSRLAPRRPSGVARRPSPFSIQASSSASPP